jgi:uncharacterized protein YeeX (DUF496 family)
MKTLFITSVVEFKLKDRVEDQIAKELFDISRNEGSRFNESIKIQNLENANSYLNHQMDRLRKYAKNNEFEKFDFLCKRLLKNSKVFLLYATNHVMENHEGFMTTKLIKIMKRVISYAKAERDTMNYKRVWIDKKEGDYGRPLGVPEVADRIYGHMMTRIMETYLCGTDQYNDNQHGGTPGRGVLTFITELAQRVKTAPRIFEFDIKGYFDHINHSSILEMFRSEVILKYLRGSLKAKPKSYTLPPVELDLATQAYLKQMKTYETIRRLVGELRSEYWDIINDTSGKITWGTSSRMPNRRKLSAWALRYSMVMNEVKFLEKEIDHDRYVYDGPKHLAKQLRTMREISNGDVFKFHDYPVDLLSSYATLQVRQRISKVSGLNIQPSPVTVEQREQGRDSWKHLNLPNQGVPQGSSFGPVLASILLGKIMPRNSLLYMDDGLIFLNNKEDQKCEYFEKVNKIVKQIGCELAPEKCRTLRTYDLMTEGFKIVGTRWTQSRNFFNYTVSSETRKGIKRKLFPGLKENYLQILTDLYSQGHITPSKYKVLRWYLNGDTLMKVRESDLFQVASKIRLLGNILTRAYSPEVSLEAMKEEIEYGIFKARLKIESSEGSLGQRILSTSKTILIESTEGKIEVKPSIFNCRAIANDVLLRYFKKELPARNLRVKGLRKAFK